MIRNFYKVPVKGLLSCHLRKLLHIKSRIYHKTPKYHSTNFAPHIINHKYYLSTISNVNCWNCNELVEYKIFSCKTCGVLQYPPQNINYYELFDISQMFDLNVEELSAKFKRLQTIFHPDKFMNKSKKEIEISEIYSSLINKAHSTLKDPLKRGFYLLELKNLPLDDSFSVDQEFLKSIIEKNEELESIGNQESLNTFKKANSEEINKLISLISESFHVSNWKEAKINLVKLNYYSNLDSKIKMKLNELMGLKEI